MPSKASADRPAPGPVMSAAMSRLGTESAFEVLARAKALEAQGKSIINLGIGQPDFQTPEHIVEAAVQALRDGHHGYTPANGIPPLREAVAADLHLRHGVEVDPANVLVVPGGKVTMFFAVLMFGEPGAEIVYPNPGFPIYESVINFSGATPVPLPLREENGFAFSAEELLGLITPRTRLIILNSPANPTGGVTPRAEIDKLVAGLAAHPEVAVMSDEIYSCMLYDGREHASLLAYPELRERVILLDGWSKTYAMTGWRLGYSVWPAALIEPATRLAINCHSCVNAAAQFAGLAALTGPSTSAAARSWRVCGKSPASPVPSPAARSTPFPTSPARVSAPRRWRRRCWRRPGSPPSPAPPSGPMARATFGCPTPTPPPTSWRRWSASPPGWTRAARPRARPGMPGAPAFA